MSPAAAQGEPGGSTARRLPFRFFHVRVAAVRDLTPHMRRFTFTGPDLGDFADPGWDQRIKLVLPAPVSGYEHLPTGEDWYQQWRALGKEHQPPIRTYTTRAVRPGTGAGQAQVDVDMVVHTSPTGRQAPARLNDSTRPTTPAAPAGSASQASAGRRDHALPRASSGQPAPAERLSPTGPAARQTAATHGPASSGPADPAAHAGPAARWVASAGPGSEVVLLGPDRGWPGEPGGVDFVPPEETERFLLGGDETAAPAIARILEDLPPTARGVAVVELPTAADAAYLPAHPGVEVRAAGREGRPHGELLVEGVRTAAAELCPAGQPQEVEEVDVDRDLLWEVPRTARGGAALRRTTLYAWLAGEAAAVRAMRRHLVAERGLDRRSVAFMGYWRLGKAEG